MKKDKLSELSLELAKYCVDLAKELILKKEHVFPIKLKEVRQVWRQISPKVGTHRAVPI